jgi:hypothetical protein
MRKGSILLKEKVKKLPFFQFFAQTVLPIRKQSNNIGTKSK